jgi:small subunit ribosomal protein S30e
LIYSSFGKCCFQERIAASEGVSSEDLLLYANGAPLPDDEILTGSMSGQMIEANVGLLGGKVHGSLARAGKVKGQTPKVEKQEKKKKKTGRAKRRFQYNRRFVNIVQGFGRKRGPNAAPVT